MHFTDPVRTRRRPSLTPMIDVVFLLLVFFMLASRFGAEAVLPMPLAGAGSTFEGAPRLIDVLPDGLRLNGIDHTPGTLIAALSAMNLPPQQALVLRSGHDGSTVQRVVTVAQWLRDAGFAQLVLVD